MADRNPQDLAEPHGSAIEQSKASQTLASDKLNKEDTQGVENSSPALPPMDNNGNVIDGFTEEGSSGSDQHSVVASGGDERTAHGDPNIPRIKKAMSDEDLLLNKLEECQARLADLGDAPVHLLVEPQVAQTRVMDFIDSCQRLRSPNRAFDTRYVDRMVTLQALEWRR